MDEFNDGDEDDDDDEDDEETQESEISVERIDEVRGLTSVGVPALIWDAGRETFGYL